MKRTLQLCAAMALAAMTNTALASQQPSLERALREAASGASFAVFQDVQGDATQAASAWVAENDAQRWQASFDAHGARVELRDERGELQKLELRLAAWGRPAELRVVAPARVTARGASVELARGDVVEWYLHGAGGLEQGFTLLAQPESTDEGTGIELRMRVSGDLEARATASEGIVFTDACGRVALSYSGLTAWDATGRDLDAHVIAAGEWLSILVDDTDAQYPLTIDPLIAALEAKLLPDSNSAHVLVGARVALDGDTAVAYGSYSSGGRAYVFVRTANGWVREARLSLAYAIGGASLGDAALDGDTIAFAINPLTGDLACWRIFERSAGIWSPVHTACAGSLGTALGLGISIAGDRLAITDDYSGPVSSKVFSRATGSWQFEQNIAPGGAVALRDDLLVISTNPAPNWSGPQVRVYSRSGTTWSLLATVMTLSDGVFPVAIDEEHTIAVGDSGASRVHLLRRQGAAWTPWQTVLPPAGVGNIGFGKSIAFESGTLAVGAEGDDGAAINAGAVFVYRRDGGWSQALKVTAPDATTGDAFGSGVALSGNRLLVGAPYDDDVGGNGGSAYVFTLASEAEVYCTAKVNSLGCLPEIEFSGAASASSASPFQITARQVLNNKMGVSYYGLTGRASAPFQDGVRCVGLPVRRTGTQMSGGNPGASDCSGSYGIDFNARIQSGIDANLVPGVQVNLQFWSRDGGVPSGTGLSDAIEFVIGA